MPDKRPKPSIRIRSFTQADAEVCKNLYMTGIIRGKIADNDTGLDIDDIASAYMNSPSNHFWVAEDPGGQVVGMIGVQQHDSGEGEIRRLRVHKDARGRGIGSLLLETAIQFCRERAHLKVTLDTGMDFEPAIKLFEKFRFRLSRKREISDRILLYFYLDLYSGDPSRKTK